MINKGEKWLTINNRTLMANICELIRKKDINIELIKVKAHTGIRENKIADRLAKREISRNIDNLEVNELEANTNYIRATPIWRNHSIEMKIRKFIKIINITN